MKKIYLSVYDRDLNFQGIIDCFTSLRWRRKYFETGEFELTLSPTENNLKYLKEDNILVRSDLTEEDEVGIIETIKKKDDKGKVTITVYGSFLLSLLKRRIIKNRINFSGTYIEGFRALLNGMRSFSKLDLTESDIESDHIDFQCTYKNVYTQHVKLSKASNVAGKIVADLKNKRFKYINYIGKDRTCDQTVNTRYEFSENNSNIDSAEHTHSTKNVINDILVGGAGEDDNRVLRNISTVNSNTHDFDIRESFLDAKNQSNKDITTAQYNAILDDLGKAALVGPTESFEATVNPLHYRTRWNLGDIVYTKKESWNLDDKKRITEVEEVFEKGKYDVIPVYGTPVAETYDKSSD